MPSRRATLALAAAALAAGLGACDVPWRDGEPGAEADARLHLVVTPLAGAPTASGPRLARLVAASLRDMGLSAGDDAAATGYLLSGAVEAKPRPEGRALLVITWRLADPEGRPVGEIVQVRDVESEAWRQGEVALLALLAERVAPRIRRLAAGPPPAPGRDAPLTPLYVAPVDGAGAGRLPLAAAMKAALEGLGATIARDFDDGTYLVLGAAYLAPREAGGVEAEIYWTIMAPDGAEIAVVATERELAVEPGEGGWTNVAPELAADAAPRVIAIVRRTGPPR